MDLKEFVHRVENGEVVDYEQGWNAHLDPRLQLGIIVAAIAAAAAVPIGLWCTPALASFAHTGALGGWLGWGNLSLPLLALISSPLFLGVNVLLLGLYALVWHKTQGFRQGNLVWHNTGLGMTAVGSLNVLAIGVPVAIGILSIVFTVVLIVAGFFLFLAVLGGAR